MSTKTVGFTVAEEDDPRRERLTQRFGHGNRSAFLLEVIHQMEVVDRPGRLAELQAYGVARSAAAGLSHEDAVQVVRRALRTLRVGGHPRHRLDGQRAAHEPGTRGRQVAGALGITQGDAASTIDHIGRRP